MFDLHLLFRINKQYVFLKIPDESHLFKILPYESHAFLLSLCYTEAVEKTKAEVSIRSYDYEYKYEFNRKTKCRSSMDEILSAAGGKYGNPAVYVDRISEELLSGE